MVFKAFDKKAMDLDNLLAACLSNEDQVRSAAEQALKAQSGRVELVPELLQRVQHAPDPQLRQLAAVLLRKRVARQWQLLPLEVSLASSAAEVGGASASSALSAAAFASETASKHKYVNLSHLQAAVTAAGMLCVLSCTQAVCMYSLRSMCMHVCC